MSVGLADILDMYYEDVYTLPDKKFPCHTIAKSSRLSRNEVVLSSEGSIIGFQPTSGVAVNHWAANPLAKELFGGKNVAPGVLELGLKISHPSEVIVLELLMSVNPDSYFAFVRPISIAGKR
ncbi:isoform 1 [Olea europaea subsp. europaea]|uniref:Isoform 1 n=1 Tax=Olea europaea subsp. europaea TaxID=158383 RepID=A0A8S0PFK2_OLEEU|nr:isoform 1 [Olea europaea subsp. europaea]